MSRTTKLYCLLIYLIFMITKSNALSRIPIADSKVKILTCLNRIIHQSFEYGKEVTYVDINSKNNDILKVIHTQNHFSIVSRTTDKEINVSNEGYIITASNPLDFIEAFPNLVEEISWKPDVNFLVVINNASKEHLNEVFDLLLEKHVFYILLINNTKNPELYTYNVFENSSCGQRYDRIIEKGKCSDNLEDLFITKSDIRLVNCTLVVSTTHWPPYSIDPQLIKGNMGIEEYIIRLLSEKEQFKIVIPEYRDDGQEFTEVESLLKRNTHIIYGGMFLTSARAIAFDFICDHLVYADDLRIIVKKSIEVPRYMNLYLEFHEYVWILLFVTCILYIVFVLIVLRPSDKIRLIYVLCDYFFQHGKRCKCLLQKKILLGLWIWFTYLINTFYQSSLMGLTTHPVVGYQISSETDITDYKIKPCISTVMRIFYLRESKYKYTKNHLDKECDELMESIATVSESYELYSITLYLVYMYNKYKFYNEFGASNIHSLPPLNKVMYGIYFYKGFPLTQKLKIHTLRLRESGLIQFFFQKKFERQLRTRRFKSKPKVYRLYIPWVLLATGYLVSGIAFIVEMFLPYYGH